MYQTTVEVGGMMCGMCEAHVSDAIRKKFPDAKKVKASHTKKKATFLTEQAPSEEDVQEAIKASGYDYISSKSEPYEKKGLFHK